MGKSTVRIRDKRWDKVKKKAMELIIQEKEVIKETDIIDAVVELYVENITIEDIKKAKKTR